MKLVLVAPLIFLEFIFLQSESQGLGIVAVDKKTCLKVQKTKVPVSRLKSYTRQTLPIEAILFVSIINKELCADPNMDWVKKAVAELDKRAKYPSTKMSSATNNENTKKASATNNKNTKNASATNNKNTKKASATNNENTKTASATNNKNTKKASATNNKNTKKASATNNKKRSRKPPNRKQITKNQKTQ